MYLYRSLSKWVFLALLAAQCKAVDSSSHPEKELQNILAENIGIDYHTIPNESKTFALYIQDVPTAKIGTNYIHYLVIELKTNRIAEKGKYLHGHCKWLDDSSIEIVDMPGIIKENQQTADFKKIVVIQTSKTQIP